MEFFTEIVAAILHPSRLMGVDHHMHVLQEVSATCIQSTHSVLPKTSKIKLFDVATQR